MQTHNQYSYDHNLLLRSLAEQIKSPLVHITRLSELDLSSPKIETVQDIAGTSSAAINLIDSYILSLHLSSSPTLDLEPVSVGVVLQDVAHDLSALAKHYDCRLEVSLDRSHVPVVAHRQSLKLALSVLGQAYIEAIPEKKYPHEVFFRACKSAEKQAVGVFGYNMLSASDLTRGRSLYGKARQPFNSLSAQSGAGVFVADSLFLRMNSSLKVSRLGGKSGLSADLLSSMQLQLI